VFPNLFPYIKTLGYTSVDALACVTTVIIEYRLDIYNKKFETSDQPIQITKYQYHVINECTRHFAN